MKQAGLKGVDVLNYRISHTRKACRSATFMDLNFYELSVFEGEKISKGSMC